MTPKMKSPKKAMNFYGKQGSNVLASLPAHVAEALVLPEVQAKLAQIRAMALADKKRHRKAQRTPAEATMRNSNGGNWRLWKAQRMARETAEALGKGPAKCPRCDGTGLRELAPDDKRCLESGCFAGQGMMCSCWRGADRKAVHL